LLTCAPLVNTLHCCYSNHTNRGPPWHGSGAYGLWGSCRFHFLGI